MGPGSKMPPQFAAIAERRVWFNRENAEQVLDWIEASGQRFLGMDLAEKQADGMWELKLESLNLSDHMDSLEAVRKGRSFMAEFDGDGRLFELVWEGRSK